MSEQQAKIDAPTAAVVNALYPNETLHDIPATPDDIRVQTARHAIAAYLATPPERGRDGLREWCREDLADGERCHAPADFFLWGKMFPAEALGPRCYDHAVEHTHHSMPARCDQWAVFDLRRPTPPASDVDSDNAAAGGAEGLAEERELSWMEQETLRRIAQAKADERERIAQAIENGAIRRPGQFNYTADYADGLRGAARIARRGES